MNDADSLEDLVSPARFAVFVADCGSDRERAAALYHWSAALTGALHVELGYFEIAFRNRLNDTLTSAHGRLRARPRGAAWFDGPSWVRHHWWDHAAQATINDARRRAQHHPPRSPRPDAVVAELGFGFWRYLVSARYEQSLWVPILDEAFVGIPGRTAAARREFIDSRLRVLHRLRNRVAHHEPLIKPAVLLGRHGTPLSYTLDQQVAMIVEVLTWIDPTASAWLTAAAGSTTLLAARPQLSEPVAGVSTQHHCKAATGITLTRCLSDFSRRSPFCLMQVGQGLPWRCLQPPEPNRFSAAQG